MKLFLKFFLKLILGFSLLLSLAPSLQAKPIHLRKGHPVTYTVKPGDTLWSIAAKFLDNPLQWPKLFADNPQIQNPNKLYPGEVLELTLRNGQPRMIVKGGGVVKLIPSIQSTPVDEAIPPIPMNAIQPFLVGDSVATAQEFATMPIIVAPVGEHLVIGAGDKCYAVGLSAKSGDDIAIYRKGKAYIDPVTKDLLGYAAINVGEARVISPGATATLDVISTTRAVNKGDKVFPIANAYVDSDFTPKIPKHYIRGEIIDVLGGVTQIGQWNVVVINRGQDSQLEVGDVLGIFKRGKKIQNPHGKTKNDKIILPNEKAGDLLIFRVFTKVSYGLVLQATDAIHINDIITNPLV